MQPKTAYALALQANWHMCTIFIIFLKFNYIYGIELPVIIMY